MAPSALVRWSTAWLCLVSHLGFCDMMLAFRGFPNTFLISCYYTARSFSSARPRWFPHLSCRGNSPGCSCSRLPIPPLRSRGVDQPWLLVSITPSITAALMRMRLPNLRLCSLGFGMLFFILFVSCFFQNPLECYIPRSEHRQLFRIALLQVLFWVKTHGFVLRVW